MKLRHIEVFHAVYVSKSLTAAAKMLNVSQPAVTKILLHAEQQLGFLLFERNKGKLIPTEDAHRLFIDVAQVQDKVAIVDRTSRNIRQGVDGTIRIAALPSLGLKVLPQAVADFARTHPSVHFDLQTVHHNEMAARLYEHETDIVLGYAIPGGAPVRSHLIGSGELVVMYREAAFPVIDGSAVLSLLPREPFVSPRQSGPLGYLLSSELERQAVSFDEIVSAQTFYMAASLVRAGFGFTIVDNFTASAMPATGVTFRALDPQVSFSIYASHLEARPPSATAIAFLASLRSSLGSP